jgi:hypothetical protein
LRYCVVTLPAQIILYINVLFSTARSIRTD